ncbi:MAG: MerR family transcriptional regulator [Polyangiales bacterium]
MEARRPSRWKLDELAQRAGVSPRTVRYYVQRGLVPAPEFRGPDTAYTDDHLTRLRAIRALQERHLPLDAIEAALANRTTADIARIASGEALPEGVGAAVTGATSAPAREPERATTDAEPARWLRYVLAPGVELHVDESAGDEARALADALRREAARRVG